MILVFHCIIQNLRFYGFDFGQITELLM